MNQQELRIELLKHQTHIEQTYCQSCEQKDWTSIHACNGCSHSNDLKLIGAGLMNSKKNPDKSMEYLKMLNGEKERKTINKVEEPPPETLLTLENYQALYEQGMLDKDIVVALETNRSALLKFKREHGLIGNRPTSNNKEARA